ncbi:MAG: hypothetical protein CMI55_00090 [Parcubacteria group bacterium]|nr:hypothetical protein [Parcubacteria group bacterium]|tara:strand:- start:185 stop:517 length:333 start_codon:yes stop_codon:yes gene_type:complete
MIIFLNTPIENPILIGLIALFTITSSITVFDKRLIQAKRDDPVFKADSILPQWIGLIGWLHWLIGLSIILLNWKVAITVFIIKFILSVFPVLETIGNILMSPFKRSKQKI